MTDSIRVLAVAALLLAAPVIHAHGGHPVAGGVPATGHVHLLGGIAVAPQWLVAAGIAVALSIGLRWRRVATARTAPRRDGARRGGDRARR